MRAIAILGVAAALVACGGVYEPAGEGEPVADGGGSTETPDGIGASPRPECRAINWGCQVDELGNQLYGWTCSVSNSCTKQGDRDWCCQDRCVRMPAQQCGDRESWACHGDNPPAEGTCESAGDGVWCCS